MCKRWDTTEHEYERGSSLKRKNVAVLTVSCAGTALRVAVVAKTALVCPALLCSAMAAAQQAVELPAEPTHQPSATTWTDQNRFLEIFAGQRQQDYREVDTQALTGNGVLNSEAGGQSHVGVAARWQTADGWLLHLQAQRQSGATTYNGYLQAGNGSLTPYRARTGNTATQNSVNFGYALNSITWPLLPEHWQITPLLQISQQRWVRNLVQYRETYAYNTHAIGALLQWQARAGTVLEAQALPGVHSPPA